MYDTYFEKLCLTFFSGNPADLTFEKCVDLAPGFEGANLTVIHTPVEWEALDLFNCTKSIRKINAKAELDSFLILVR
jgi:hypothetical protein